MWSASHTATYHHVICIIHTSIYCHVPHHTHWHTAMQPVLHTSHWTYHHLISIIHSSTFCHVICITCTLLYCHLICIIYQHTNTSPCDLSCTHEHTAMQSAVHTPHSTYHQMICIIYTSDSAYFYVIGAIYTYVHQTQHTAVWSGLYTHQTLYIAVISVAYTHTQNLIKNFIQCKAYVTLSHSCLYSLTYILLLQMLKLH